jgi:hypothetical protein
VSEGQAERRWLLFGRGGRSFALDAIAVRFVAPAPRVSPFASGEIEILSLIAHLGRIYPILEPAGGASRPSSDCPVAVIASGDEGELAFMADTVHGFADDTGDAVILDPRSAARSAREALHRGPAAR